MKPKVNRKADKDKISGYDVAQTPPHAVEPLLPYLPKNSVIWESACGPERLLEKALRSHGYKIQGSDLLYGEIFNFFTLQHIVWDIQLTNPPYSLKYAWIEHSFELQKPFALLVPFETLAAGKFHKLLQQFEAKVVFLTPERRINFKMPDKGWGKWEWDEKKGKEVLKGASAQFPTGWLTWGLIDTYNAPITVLPVPMRKAKYDENNEPII